MTRTYRPGWFSRSLDVRELQTDAVAPEEAPTFSSTLRERWLLTPGSEMVFALSKPSYPATPNYTPAKADIDAVTEGIDEDLWYKYGNARSTDELYSVYVDNLRRMEGRNTLARAGWKAIPATIIAELADAPTLAATLLTGGIGGAGAAATRAARMAGYARVGLVNGGVGAFAEAFRATQNPDYGLSDVVLSGLSGGGSAIGAVRAGEVGASALGAGVRIGAGGAAPYLAVAPLLGEDRSDIIIGAGSSFLLGGLVGGAGYAVGRRYQAKFEEPIREIVDREVVNDVVANTIRRNLRGSDLIARRGLETPPANADATARLAAFGLGEDATMRSVGAQRLEAFLDTIDPAAAASRRMEQFGDVLPKQDEAFLRRVDELSAEAKDEAKARLLNFADELGLSPSEKAELQQRPLRVQLAGALRLMDFADTLDIDPAYAASLGVPEGQLKAQLAATLSEKGVEFVNNAIGREKMVAKRIEARDTISSLDNAAAEYTPLTPEAVRAIDEASVNRAVEGVTDDLNRPTSAMGAAAAHGSEFLSFGNRDGYEGRQAGDFFYESYTDAVPWQADVRKFATLNSQTIAAGNSRNEFTRIASGLLSTENIQRVDARTGQPIGAQIGGDVWQSSRSAAMIIKAEAAMDEAYKAHVKGGGRLTPEQFDVAVTKARRRGGVGYEDIPGIKQAVEYSGTNVYDAGMELQHRHKVPGTDPGNRIKNYVNRQWLRDMIDDIVDRFGVDELYRALTKAYLLANPDDPPEIAALVARFIHKNAGHSEQLHPGLDFLDGDISDLIARMAESNESEALLQRFRDNALRKQRTAGNPKNFRYRIRLDETYSHTTTRGETFTIEDMLENNIRSLMRDYAIRAHGNVAAHALFQRLSSKDFEVNNIGDVLDLIKKRGVTRAVGQTEREINADVLRVESMFRIATGMPQVTNPAHVPWAHAAEAIRTGVRTNLLGSMYYSATNMGEALVRMAPDFMQFAPKLIPALTELRQRAADGQLTNMDARMFEFMTGFGAGKFYDRSYKVSHSSDKYDVITSRAATVSRNIARRVFRATLASQSMDWMHRTLGATQFAMIGDWAASGKRPSKAILNEFGWTDAQWDRIAEQANLYRTREKGGMSGKGYWQLNAHKFTPEAFADLEAGVHAFTYAAVSNPRSSSRSLFSNSVLGRFIFQFYDWRIGTLDSRFAKAAFTAKDGDQAVWAWRLGTRFVAEAMLGYALYTAWTYFRSLGREDEQEYRKKNLDDGKAWTVALGRTSYMAVTGPLIDMGMWATDNELLFAPGNVRQTNAPSLPAVATYDFLNRAVGSAANVVKAPFSDTRSVSVSDVRNIMRAIPFFPQFEPITKTVEWFSRDVLELPETSRER